MRNMMKNSNRDEPNHLVRPRNTERKTQSTLVEDELMLLKDAHGTLPNRNSKKLPQVVLQYNHRTFHIVNILFVTTKGVLKTIKVFTQNHGITGVEKNLCTTKTAVIEFNRFTPTLLVGITFQSFTLDQVTFVLHIPTNSVTCFSSF